MIKILFLSIFFYGFISASAAAPTPALHSLGVVGSNAKPSAATDVKSSAEADKKKKEEHDYKKEFTVHKNVITFAYTQLSNHRYFFTETDNGFAGICYQFNKLEPGDTHLYQIAFGKTSVCHMKYFLTGKELILPFLKPSFDDNQVPTWSKDLRRFIFVKDTQTLEDNPQEKFSAKPD